MPSHLVIAAGGVCAIDVDAEVDADAMQVLTDALCTRKRCMDSFRHDLPEDS